MELHGTTTIKGSGIISIPATDFMISPVTGGTLKIDGLAEGISNPQTVKTLTDGEYTKVHGAVPYTRFFIDGLAAGTTFYVKW